ncbi:MAG: ABC transporter substrate-binding protein [Firmicutes bacterium]|nr:ABC transporter substrate-binding protein [Bacillota bacterium]
MKILKVIIILAVFVGCAVQASEEPTTFNIQIAYLPITHSTALMVMNEQQSYSDGDYQMDLVRFTAWPDVVDALRTGRVDGASILFEVALQAKLEDDSLVMLSLTHRDGNVIVVDNDINTYQDLIGRVVAIPHRLSPQNTLLQMILDREGISPNDIQIIEISPAEMPFSMASGAISAYIVAEPFGSVAENAGVGRIIETSEDIFPNAICCVLVFREESIRNPELLAWILENFERAAEITHARDYRVVEVFKEHARLSEDVIERSLEHTTFHNLNLTEEEYYQITDIILHYGVLEEVPSFRSFVIE